ncbi:helix-turn-helix domain-containing protein [Streptomyces avicenniae]|uniref:helix-turn-helix domain-containing protein n=1 Tax=Streptomyces avicenniae TaxID=500153 RepID=UPI00069BE7F0|nr:helix-turn-helix transcriptional regulator [Streptomyces avicenniae]
MAQAPRPTARRIELCDELRRLRVRAGLTLEQAVEGLDLSERKLQRIETELHGLRSAEVLKALMDRYGVESPDARNHLLEMFREASSQEWFTQYRALMPSGMPRFVGVESAAIEVRAWHPTLVPGLLQTESYARALHQLAKPIRETTTEFIASNIELRMRRRAAVINGDLRLLAVLYEPALRYQAAAPEAMKEQYEEIAKLAELDTVTIQVLPARTRGYVSPHDFTLLDLGSNLPAIVQVDTAWGAVSVTDKPREVARFRRKHEVLTQGALSPEATVPFLQALLREIP